MEKQALKTKRHYGLYRKKSENYWKNKEKADRIISYYWNSCKYPDWICKRNFSSVPENLEKIAAFFQVAVAEIDPRLRNDFVVIDSEIERLYKQLDEGNQENLLSYGKSLLTHQKERQKIEKQYHSYSVYDSFCILSKSETSWYRLVLIKRSLTIWLLDSYRFPRAQIWKGAVVLVKQTYYDQAGAIYAIDFDGKRWSNVSFVRPTVFDWFPPIRNIVIKSFH